MCFDARLAESSFYSRLIFSISECLFIQSLKCVYIIADLVMDMQFLRAYV